MENKYFLLRHGETTHQIEKKDLVYFWPEDRPPCPLTEKGAKQIKLAAKKLAEKKIDLIFCSDALRTRQTAEIVAGKLELKVKLDKRLRDVNWGIYQGQSKEEPYKLFYTKEGFSKRPKKGESYFDLKKRLENFLNEAEKKHKNKTILIVSHGDPLWILRGIIRGLKKPEEFLAEKQELYLKIGELIKTQN